MPASRYDPRITDLSSRLVRNVLLYSPIGAVAESVTGDSSADITADLISVLEAEDGGSMEESLYGGHTPVTNTGNGGGGSSDEDDDDKAGGGVPAWVVVGGVSVLAGVALYVKYGTPGGRIATLFKKKASK